MKASRLALAIPVAMYAVLWCGGVASYVLLGGPPPEAAWTAPSFLALAALLVLLLSPLREWPMLLGMAALGFAAEALGVAYGIPFGAYRYTDTLFPQALGVPLAMAAAWLVLFAYVRQMTRSLLAAAAWMTAIDLVIDPLAARVLDYWAWERSGHYYGIPWSNFAGWFLVSLVLFALAPRRSALHRGVAWLGLSVVLFFTVIALGVGLVWAGMAGLSLVILHAAQTHRAARQSAQSTVPGPTDSPPR